MDSYGSRLHNPHRDERALLSMDASFPPLDAQEDSHADTNEDKRG